MYIERERECVCEGAHESEGEARRGEHGLGKRRDKATGHVVVAVRYVGDDSCTTATTAAAAAISIKKTPKTHEICPFYPHSLLRQLTHPSFFLSL